MINKFKKIIIIIKTVVIIKISAEINNDYLKTYK